MSLNKSISSQVIKREYIQFSNKTLHELKSFYKTAKYPSRDEIKSLADKCAEKFERVRNWFRAQRKKQFDAGTLKHQKKHVFSKSEVIKLEEIYKNERYPSQETYKDIAIRFQSEPKNIKNWFGYRRKLERKNSKKTKQSQEIQNSVISTQETATQQQQAPPATNFQRMNFSNFPVVSQNPFNIPIVASRNSNPFMNIGYCLMPLSIIQPNFMPSLCLFRK